MSDETATVKVEKYGGMYVVSDDAPDEIVHGPLRDVAVGSWFRSVEREGYVPLGGAPTADLQTAVFPQYVEDPDTGQSVKLPDRAWRVVGYVHRRVTGN